MKTDRKPRILHVDICLDDVRDEECIQIRLIPEKRQFQSRIMLLDWVELKQEEYKKRRKSGDGGREPPTGSAP